MKLLVHDYAGHASPIQLSRELARRGHQVLHLYAGHNQTPRGELRKREDDPEEFNIRGVFIRKPLQKNVLLQRWFQEREYGRYVIHEIRKFHPQVVFSANTPLDPQRAILQETLRQDARFVFWLQDLIGIASLRILSKKMPFLGTLIGSYYIRMEKRLLIRSHAVIAISEDFAPILDEWGIDEARIHIIPNWAPIEKIPVMPKRNPWAKEHGISDEFVFMYTGTLGLKHNPDVLRDLAETIREENGSSKIVVVSEGPAATWLRNMGDFADGKRLLVVDFQPVERYAEVLASADVLIAILEKEAGIFSVPSKILSYLCAGRPLLLSIPKENLAARIVQENKAGFVVDPGEKEKLLDAACRLMNNPALREEMGTSARRYAEEAFNINQIAGRFEVVIGNLS